MKNLTPKIFLVDDDEFVLRLSATVIARSGWQVRSFRCVDDCLHAFEQEEPDCIVSDLEMPRRTGADLVRLLDVLGFDVPCVIATSRPESVLADQARMLGAVEVLGKPVGAWGLAAAVRRGLRHRLSTQARRLRSGSLPADRASELLPANDPDFRAIVEAQMAPDLIVAADFRIAGLSGPG